MRQRGFTLLEMMLVLLLIGSAASLVIMSFPAVQQNTPQQQLACFQAQLDFALDDSQQNGQLLGIVVRPEGWQFKILRRQPENAATSSGSDSWQGYVWQEWQPRRGALGGEMPEGMQLELEYPGLESWPPADAEASEPDIMLLPGGEITPFRLLFGPTGVWLQVDNSGLVSTAEYEAEP